MRKTLVSIVGLLAVLGLVTVPLIASATGTGQTCPTGIGVAGYAQNFSQDGMTSSFTVQAGPVDWQNDHNTAKEVLPASGGVDLTASQKVPTMYETSAAVVLVGIPLDNFKDDSFAVTLAGTGFVANAWFGPPGATAANSTDMYKDGYSAVDNPHAPIKGSSTISPLSNKTLTYHTMKDAANALPNDDVYFWVGVDIEAGQATANHGEDYQVTGHVSSATQPGACPSTSPSPSTTASPAAPPGLPNTGTPSA